MAGRGGTPVPVVTSAELARRFHLPLERALELDRDDVADEARHFRLAPLDVDVELAHRERVYKQYASARAFERKASSAVAREEFKRRRRRTAALVRAAARRRERRGARRSRSVDPASRSRSQSPAGGSPFHTPTGAATTFFHHHEQHGGTSQSTFTRRHVSAGGDGTHHHYHEHTVSHGEGGVGHHDLEGGEHKGHPHQAAHGGGFRERMARRFNLSGNRHNRSSESKWAPSQVRDRALHAARAGLARGPLACFRAGQNLVVNFLRSSRVIFALALAAVILYFVSDLLYRFQKSLRESPELQKNLEKDYTILVKLINAFIDISNILSSLWNLAMPPVTYIGGLLINNFLPMLEGLWGSGSASLGAEGATTITPIPPPSFSFLAGVGPGAAYQAPMWAGPAWGPVSLRPGREDVQSFWSNEAFIRYTRARGAPVWEVDPEGHGGLVNASSWEEDPTVHLWPSALQWDLLGRPVGPDGRVWVAKNGSRNAGFPSFAFRGAPAARPYVGDGPLLEDSDMVNTLSCIISSVLDGVTKLAMWFVKTAGTLLTSYVSYLVKDLGLSSLAVRSTYCGGSGLSDTDSTHCKNSITSALDVLVKVAIQVGNICAKIIQALIPTMAKLTATLIKTIAEMMPQITDIAKMIGNMLTDLEPLFLTLANFLDSLLSNNIFGYFIQAFIDNILITTCWLETCLHVLWDFWAGILAIIDGFAFLFTGHIHTSNITNTLKNAPSCSWSKTFKEVVNSFGSSSSFLGSTFSVPLTAFHPEGARAARRHSWATKIAMLALRLNDLSGVDNLEGPFGAFNRHLTSELRALVDYDPPSALFAHTTMQMDHLKPMHPLYKHMPARASGTPDIYQACYKPACEQLMDTVILPMDRRLFSDNVLPGDVRGGWHRACVAELEPMRTYSSAATHAFCRTVADALLTQDESSVVNATCATFSDHSHHCSQPTALCHHVGTCHEVAALAYQQFLQNPGGNSLQPGNCSALAVWFTPTGGARSLHHRFEDVLRSVAGQDEVYIGHFKGLGQTAAAAALEACVSSSGTGLDPAARPHPLLVAEAVCRDLGLNRPETCPGGHALAVQHLDVPPAQWTPGNTLATRPHRSQKQEKEGFFEAAATIMQTYHERRLMREAHARNPYLGKPQPVRAHRDVPPPHMRHHTTGTLGNAPHGLADRLAGMGATIHELSLLGELMGDVSGTAWQLSKSAISHASESVRDALTTWSISSSTHTVAASGGAGASVADEGADQTVAVTRALRRVALGPHRARLLSELAQHPQWRQRATPEGKAALRRDLDHYLTVGALSPAAHQKAANALVRQGEFESLADALAEQALTVENFAALLDPSFFRVYDLNGRPYPVPNVDSSHASAFVVPLPPYMAALRLHPPPARTSADFNESVYTVLERSSVRVGQTEDRGWVESAIYDTFRERVGALVRMLTVMPEDVFAEVREAAVREEEARVLQGGPDPHASPTEGGTNFILMSGDGFVGWDAFRHTISLLDGRRLLGRQNPRDFRLGVSHGAELLAHQARRLVGSSVESRAQGSGVFEAIGGNSGSPDGEGPMTGPQGFMKMVSQTAMIRQHNQESNINTYSQAAGVEFPYEAQYFVPCTPQFTGNTNHGKCATNSSAPVPVQGGGSTFKCAALRVSPCMASYKACGYYSGSLVSHGYYCARPTFEGFLPQTQHSKLSNKFSVEEGPGPGTGGLHSTMSSAADTNHSEVLNSYHQNVYRTSSNGGDIQGDLCEEAKKPPYVCRDLDTCEPGAVSTVRGGGQCGGLRTTADSFTGHEVATGNKVIVAPKHCLYPRQSKKGSCVPLNMHSHPGTEYVYYGCCQPGQVYECSPANLACDCRCTNATSPSLAIPQELAHLRGLASCPLDHSAPAEHILMRPKGMQARENWRESHAERLHRQIREHAPFLTRLWRSAEDPAPLRTLAWLTGAPAPPRDGGSSSSSSERNEPPSPGLGFAERFHGHMDSLARHVKVAWHPRRVARLGRDMANAVEAHRAVRDGWRAAGRLGAALGAVVSRSLPRLSTREDYLRHFGRGADPLDERSSGLVGSFNQMNESGYCIAPYDKPYACCNQDSTPYECCWGAFGCIPPIPTLDLGCPTQLNALINASCKSVSSAVTSYVWVFYSLVEPLFVPLVYGIPPILRRPVVLFVRELDGAIQRQSNWEHFFCLLMQGWYIPAFLLAMVLLSIFVSALVPLFELWAEALHDAKQETEIDELQREIDEEREEQEADEEQIRDEFGRVEEEEAHLEEEEEERERREISNALEEGEIV